jgi:hypothetical protein
MMVEYWIHNNVVKIITGKTETAKTKCPGIKSKANRIGKSGKQKYILKDFLSGGRSI